jgi:hypothetical protein
VLAIGAGTLIALFLGDSILVPVTEVGSGSSAFGWFASCASMLLLSSRSSSPSAAVTKANVILNANVVTSQPVSRKLRIIAAFGAIAALALVLMKFLPMFPGHFSFAEYVALGIWLLIGLILRRR